MITKNDCLVLLNELTAKGIDTVQITKELLRSQEVDINVIKFINDNRMLDVTEFYEKLRKSYNNKKSSLYINILKEKFDEPKDVLSTLASLNLQIILFSKHVDDVSMFLRHTRFEEIQKCFLKYSKDADIIPCQQLLRLVKADLKALDYINRGV